MSLFNEWHRRHLAADPQEPASPPPFKVNDRVVVRDDSDDPFLAGLHGQVLNIHFTSDPEDVFGPWVVRVHIDGMRDPLNFEARELALETGPAPTPKPLVANVRQPEDEEDFASARLPKRIPFREDVPATPIYDQVREEALAVGGFANGVEADLRTLTERNGR